MKKLLKTELTTPKLEIIQSNFEIFCYHCGSKNYTKKGFSRQGKQKYSCKECQREFLDYRELESTKKKIIRENSEIFCHHFQTDLL